MSLELKNVEKKVGIDTHIYPTSLKLEKNTINVLLGSTLAGKTTLMQIMADLVMSRMEAADKGSNAYGGCGPRLNKPREASYWLNKKGSCLLYTSPSPRDPT